MPVDANTICNGVRVLLNDTITSVFSNTYLLPFLNMAYRELQSKLEANGVPYLEEVSAVIEVSSTSTMITVPNDFVRPIELYDRADGSSEDFQLVTELDDEPINNNPDNNRIIWWVWREGQIKISSPDNNREVKIRYVKDLGELVNDGSQIAFPSARLFLENRTAALAASFQGENTTRSAELNAVAGYELSSLIRTEVKKLQSTPVRNKPFMRRNNSWLRRSL